MKTKKIARWSLELSIILTIFGVCLGQLGRLTSYLSFGLYLHDLGILLGLVTIIVNFYITYGRSSLTIIRKRFVGRWRLLTAWLVLFTALACLKTESWLPLVYGVRLLGYSLVLFKFYQVWRHKPKLRSFCILLLTLVSLGFGFWQYIYWPDMRFLATLSFDDHLYRLIGTWFDPAITGGILLLIGLDWLHRYIQVKNRNSQSIIGLLCLLIVIALGLTFSRASYLAMGCAYIGLAFVHWQINKSRRLITISIILLMALATTVFLAPKPTGEGVNLARTTSISARVANEISLTTQLTYKDWLFGQGLFYQTGLTNQINHARLPNNILIFLLTDFGLIGSSILAYLFLPGLLRAAKLNPFLAALLIGLLTASQFNNLMLHPAIWITSVLILANFLRSESDAQ